jgi:hypothetical protein
VKQDREWFRRSFERPTEAQAEACPAIARGEDVLGSAVTGSGKTLAALLSRARSPPWPSRPSRGGPGSHTSRR